MVFGGAVVLGGVAEGAVAGAAVGAGAEDLQDAIDASVYFSSAFSAFAGPLYASLRLHALSAASAEVIAEFAAASSTALGPHEPAAPSFEICACKAAILFIAFISESAV